MTRLTPRPPSTQLVPPAMALTVLAIPMLALLAWLGVSLWAGWPQAARADRNGASGVEPAATMVAISAPDRSAAEAHILTAIEAAAGRFGVRARSTRPQPETRPDAIVVRTDWTGREDRVYRALEALTGGETPLVITQLVWRMGLENEANLSLEVTGLWRQAAAPPAVQVPTP